MSVSPLHHTVPVRLADVSFHNRRAAVTWVFAAAFMTLVTAMTWIVIRDGAPSGYDPLAVLAVVAVFWVGGLGLTAFAASKSCVRVSVLPDGGVHITRRFPLGKRARRFLVSEIAPAMVVESLDDEGNPYFFSRFVLPDGETVDFAESHHRATCEAACVRFNAALHPRIV